MFCFWAHINYLFGGKVKHELRVTSSNPRVRRLKAQLTRLKHELED